VIVALGVDPMGKKHLLGVREGASENAVVVSALLEDLLARGLSPRQRRLFVIDGAKAGDAPSAVEFEGSDGSWHFYAAFSVASSFELFPRSARLSRDR
jgi:transposase-like protein